MKKVNFAIIGCGRISYKHIDAIIDNNAVANLIAVCDIDKSRAQKRAREYVEKMKSTVKEPVIYVDYKELLENEDIQVVVIATESGKHAGISIQALHKNKHVIVEKPMALSTKDANEMIYLANKNNLKLCVSHQNRFNSPIKKLKEAIENGRLGKIYAASAKILWNRNKEYYEQASWRGTYKEDGGCLMNQCIHNIDLLQWMIDSDISEINGIMSNYIHPFIEAEDYGSIQILFDNGVIGNIEGTVNIYPQNLEETLSIYGEKGTVVIGGKAVNEIVVWDLADEKETLYEIQNQCNEEISNVYGNGHSLLYTNFINSLNNKEPLVVDGEEGKKALSIILHAYVSNKRKERIKYNSVDIYIDDNGISEE